MATHIANGDSRLSRWLRVREFAVPPSMIENATARRLAGDWAGACAAARVDVDLDLRSAARAHGRELAARVRADLRRLAPDLLRWHLPRIAPDGLLRPGLTVALARYEAVGRDGPYPVWLVVRTPPAWADAGQRVSIGLWDGSLREAGARRHPHPHPSPRFRLDLHRHLWDARRADELRERCGADRPSTDDGAVPHPDLPRSVPGERPYAVARWAAEAGRLLLAERRGAFGRADGLPEFTGVDVRSEFTGTVGLPQFTSGDGGPQFTGTAGRPELTGADGRPHFTGTVGRSEFTGTAGRSEFTGTAGRPEFTGADGRYGFQGAGAPRAAGATASGIGGAVVVRIGRRRRLVLDLVADGDGAAGLRDWRIAAVSTAHAGTGLPVLPDAATWVLPDLELIRAGAIEVDRLHPLVAAALVPGHTPDAPSPPAEQIRRPHLVECRGARHRIGLVDGVLAPLDHDPAEIRREELLAALTGTPLPCLQAIDRAHRRPDCLAGVRERLDHGDTAGALAVVEGLLGPEAVLREGPLRDELEAAAQRRVIYGLFRAGLVGPGPDRIRPGLRRPPGHRSRPRHTTTH